MTDPRQAQISAKVRQIGQAIQAALAKSKMGLGFMLFLFDMNRSGKPGFLSYISNGQRQDVIAAMEDWIATQKKEADALRPQPPANAPASSLEKKPFGPQFGNYTVAPLIKAETLDYPKIDRMAISILELLAKEDEISVAETCACLAQVHLHVAEANKDDPDSLDARSTAATVLASIERFYKTKEPS